MKQVVGLCVGLFFLQVFAGAITHVALVEHAFCEVHLTVEHGEGHAVDGELAEHGATTAPDHPHDEESGDEDCQLLAWLDGPQVTTPSATAGLLSLPPPHDTAVRAPDAFRLPAPRHIEIRHFSPGLSPPDHLSLV